MSKHLDDLLFLFGAMLVTIGMGLYSLPAGFITAGLFCIAGGVVYGRYLALAAESESRA